VKVLENFSCLRVSVFESRKLFSCLQISLQKIKVENIFLFAGSVRKLFSCLMVSLLKSRKLFSCLMVSVFQITCKQENSFLLSDVSFKKSNLKVLKIFGFQFHKKRLFYWLILVNLQKIVDFFEKNEKKIIFFSTNKKSEN
jgi:hypothetical protein